MKDLIRRRMRRLLFEQMEERRVFTTIDLAMLTAAQGTTIFGADTEDQSGWSVSGAGDVNGDGFDDVIIGAKNADGIANAEDGAGESYLIFGRAVPLSSIDLSNLGPAGVVIYGDNIRDASGISTSSAGDVNGDGFDDFVIGASYAAGDGRGYSGVSYVIFGGSALPISIDLASLGTRGISIFGARLEDLSGSSVSVAGDINADGFDDLIIGAHRADQSFRSDVGNSLVIFGGVSLPATVDLRTLGSFGMTIVGVDGGDRSGRSVSRAGDVNGDGIDDLVVGAPGADGVNAIQTGASYVVFGRSSLPAELNLASLGGNGIKIYGAERGDYSGVSVSDAGDVNGDGFDDIIIGASSADAAGNLKGNAGESYLIFGSSSVVESIDLANLGSSGMTMYGARGGDLSGSSVSTAGDINGDGFDDLLIGAWRGRGSDTSAGESYVIFGRPSFPATIDLGSPTLAGITILGANYLDYSGFSVSAAGDVNGDGFDDVLIGARSANAFEKRKSDAGESYIVFGGNFTNSITNSGTTGVDNLVGTGDINVMNGGRSNDTLIGNGGADVLIGGQGDDVLAISDLSVKRIVGGTGQDTLRLDEHGIHLNLTTIPDTRILGIERIDVTGNGNNSLTVNQREVLNISDESNTLQVLGNSGDRVFLDAGWTRQADESLGGVNHNVRTKGNATLKVAAAVSVISGPEIDVFENGTERFDGVGTASFGNVGIGTTSDKTFVVRNNGLEPLIVQPVTVTSGFTVSLNFTANQSIAPGNQAEFRIRLNTASLGTFNGNVTIPSNDSDENPFRIAVTGVVAAPVIEVLNGTVPVADGTGAIDFGSTHLNQTITRTITIKNSGPVELILGSVAAQVGSGFSIVSQPATTVAATTGQTTFQVRFDASTAGLKSGTISFSTNDPLRPTFDFTVTGFVNDKIDLVVSDISVSPSSTGVGGQVDVSWTITNQGTGEFRGGFSDKVFISSDTTPGNDEGTAGDVSFPFVGTLTPGEPVRRTKSITLPAGATGSKYIVVRTDVFSEVNENISGGELNNFAIDDRVLNILAADLQPFDVQVAPVLPTGTSTRVAWKVRNIGSAATLTGATWQDEVFLSTDKILDANDTRLSSVDNPSGLSESGSTGTDRYASFADVVIPYGVFGVRYVMVRSDSGTSVVELNEGNNVESSTATNITWQPPDLRVETVVSQGFAFSGAPTRVSWSVRNVGRTAMLATEGIWRDRVYLSTDATLNTQQDRALGEFMRTGLLLPGEGYTQTVDVTMPVASLLTADDYFLIVETDWRNDVKEGLFEGNNWTSETSTTRVLRVPPPDLVVDSISSIPASIFAGQSLDVSFRVKNSGAGDTEPSNTRWSDAVYLSTDGTLDGSDRLLGRIDRNGGLKKDDPPYVQSGRFQVPSDLVGEHKLIVVTNVFGQVFGDDVSNNQRVTTSSIDIQKPPADLDVISVTPTASTIVVGSPLSIEYKVRNIGPQATTASTWTDRVYLSRDTILDVSTDALFGEFVRTGALEANAEYQGSATKTVSQVGAFYVLVQSDAGNTVFEIVDGNNIQASSRQVNVVPTPADLTTSNIVVPSVARAGFDTSISYRVSNTGPNPTLGSNWLDRVYLSADAVLDSSDRLLKSVSRFGALAAAPEFYEVTTAISLPDGLTGQYHVIVHADALDTVFEQDNLDNIAASVTKVTVVSQPADLVVTSILAAPAITVGQSLRLDWTVKNQGTGDTVVSSWLERVYLSDDNIFNAQTDSLLREITYTNISNSVEAPLVPERSINRSEVVNFADDVLGDKFLFVSIDPTNVVFEPGREDNNVSVAQLIKLFPRDTDLQVTSVTAPASTTEGVAFNVSWTVKNLGTASTNAAFWYDEVYVSTDNVLSTNDVRLGSVRRSNPLSGTGQSDNQYSVTGSFAIPIGVTAGIVAPLFVLVKTDGGTVSLVPEKNENNNVTAASASTTVSPGTVALLPDLRITSVQAPTSVQVGQPITVNWSVQNTGPGSIVNGSWFDSVYLSLDQVLDRQNGQNQSRDIFLGTKAQVRSMLKDATYSDFGIFTVPAGLSGDYFLLVATDFRNDVAEGATGEFNNLGIGSNPLTVQPKAPADLLVGTITIPATGISGQAATISYTVANNGQNAAIGSWYDTVYISADATWDVNDAMFGRVLHTGDVQPLGSYSESLTATWPGVLPGNYHVIIRSDIRNQIAESNEQNNLKATLDRFALDVTALMSGVPIDTNIGLGESAYFKIIVPANRTLGLSVDSASDTADTQLYVSKGTLPTQSRFDFSSNQAGKADHFLLVPDTEVATYYVLVRRVVSPGATPKVTVKADLIGFSLLSSDVSRVGNSGSVTIAISGAQLRGTESISLVGASPAVKRDASRFLVVDSSLVYATFDLAGLVAGSYTLAAVNESAETATLATAVNVETARGGPAKLALTAPDNVRPGQTFQATLTVYNDGNVDTAAPLVQFDSNSTMLLGHDASDLQDELVTVVVIPPGGYRDTLRPGQAIDITIVAKEKVGNGQSASLTVRTIGQSDEVVSFDSMLSDSELTEQFGPEASLIKPFLDYLTFGKSSLLVKELLTFGSGTVEPNVSHIDAVRLRQNQVAMISHFVDSVDVASQFNGIAGKSPLSARPGLPSYDLYPNGQTSTGTGKTHYIVPGFLAGDPPEKWTSSIAEQLLKICPEDEVYIVSWDSGSLSELSARAGQAFTLGAVAGILRGGLVGGLINGGAKGVNAVWDYYKDAANRARALGVHLANQIVSTGKDASRVVIHGHSLGAQAAGIAGQNLIARGYGSLGRIVGLDPAGPSFEGINTNGRLDASDATMVQVINTSVVLGRFSCDGDETYYPEVPTLQTNFLGSHSFAHEEYLQRLEKANDNDSASCKTDPKLGEKEPCKPGDRKFGIIDALDQDLRRVISVIASRDPNDIIGPSGFGPENWITATQPLNYTIRFENDPIFATAPAQRIEITQTLDSDLDARSFRLGDFGFGELFVDVPENQSFYSRRIDLRETKGIFVDAFAGINVATNEVFWRFIAIDPVTGDLPEDPLKGILPPNLNPPEGDGFVRYSVKAKAGVPTGTRIDAQARIVFDINEPIDTPPIFNTLDAVAPTSQVNPLSPELVSYQGRFPVSWSGSDDVGGSALRGFDIYVSVDGGLFRPWLSDVNYTTALYDGPVGRTYAFYAVARDNAGLSEPTPASLDTSISVVAPLDVVVEVDGISLPNDTGTLSFGTPIVSADAKKTLTVRNTGTQPLTLGSAVLTPNNAFRFVTNLQDGLVLQPGQTTNLTVQIDTAQVGAKSATLQFATNVPGKNPFTLVLSGEVYPTPALSLSVESSSIQENGAFIIASVSRNTPTDLPLTVNLVTDDAAQGTVPATVTIPSGASSVAFRFTPTNDTVPDGDHSVSISATAANMTSASVAVRVNDDDVAELTLTITTVLLRESFRTSVVSVSRNGLTTNDLTISLTTSDPSQATVPTFVMILAGQSSAQFFVTAVQDAFVDGDHSVTVTASAPGFPAETGSLTIIDDDVPTLSIVPLVEPILENGGPITVMVKRNTFPTGVWVVNLSSDRDNFPVPRSLTIPANATSTTFVISTVDDAYALGNKSFTVTASTTGLPVATKTLTIVEDDLPKIIVALATTSIRENVGPTLGEVTRNTAITMPLVVNLQSSDVTAAKVPASVTIPAGELSASFAIDILNDNRYRGDVSLQIVATADGFSESTAQLNVIEDDPSRPWHNSRNPVDVNFDGRLSPIDALLVINLINSGRSGVLLDPKAGENAPPPFVDVNQDGFLSSIDALLVINELNKLSSGEGEWSASEGMDGSTFGDLSWLDSLMADIKKDKRYSDNYYLRQTIRQR